MEILRASAAEAFALARAHPFKLLTFAVLTAEFARAVPGVYHLRCMWIVLRDVFLLRTRLAAPLERLDAPVAMRGNRVGLGALDWNLHMNNATYALEADVARYPWFTRFLAAGKSAAAYNRLAIANGTVSTVFYREMRWGQAFTMSTRCVGFDAKWVFLETRFIDEAAPAGRALHAVTLARFVFKEARGALRGKTVPPADVFALVGLAVPAGMPKSTGNESGTLLSRIADINAEAKAE